MEEAFTGGANVQRPSIKVEGVHPAGGGEVPGEVPGQVVLTYFIVCSML